MPSLLLLLIAGLLSGLLGCASAVAEPPQEAARDDTVLESLRIERDKFVAEFGEGHPSVKARDKQIRLLEALQSKSSRDEAGADKEVDIKQAYSIETRLRLASERRARLVAEYGARHPSVKVTDSEIADLQKALRREQLARISQFSDEELRAVIGRLMQRVSDLEKEVQSLRSAQPRIDFLEE